MQTLFNLNLPLVKTNRELAELFSTYPGYHQSFLAIHVRDDFHKIRMILEESWVGFSEYADRNFIKEFQSYFFHERAWELYLFKIFHDRKINLPPRIKNAGGPDFLIKTPSHNIWIEATVAGKGTGNNEVETSEDLLKDVPFGEIVVRGGTLDELNHPKVRRITSVLNQKWNNYKGSHKNKYIHPDDIFIIAVSGAQIDGDVMAEHLILEAVGGVESATRYPILDSSRLGKPYRQLRAHIPNANSAHIDIGMFEREEYADISGVMYCGNRIVRSILEFGDQLGKDIIFVHNPKTENSKRIPKEIFNFGTHFERTPEGWERTEF